MRQGIIVVFVLLLAVAHYAFAAIPTESLEPVSLETLDFDGSVWDRKNEVLIGIESSLKYLRSPEAKRLYEKLGTPELNRLRVAESLARFAELLLSTKSREEFESRVREEFVAYGSKGHDGQGTVKFTGYFQPVYRASRTRTAEFRYPIYRCPTGFARWAKPHPSREWLEGPDGTGNPLSPLHGFELAFLASRREVYMIHVQGSAVLELENGEKMAVGFANATDHQFRGVNPEKGRGIDDGEYAQNNRFILFKENRFDDPIGSLGVPVLPERSIATDKSKMPAGGLALIRTRLPNEVGEGIVTRSRFVLDHDAGKAIKGAGRVDLFMGTGPEAERRAHAVYADGRLYYLLLK